MAAAYGQAHRSGFVSEQYGQFYLMKTVRLIMTFHILMAWSFLYRLFHNATSCIRWRQCRVG